MRKWYEPTNPENVIPVPWLHPAVVAYMDMLIKPDWTILEHGAGGSTLWFAERAAKVVSIESNMQWVDKLSAIAPKNVIFANEVMGDELFDLILIDGQPRESRIKWAMRAPELTKPGGVVVFDNCNRVEYAKSRGFLRGSAEHYITFEVNPPGHSQSVTEMYRMPGGRCWI